MAKEHRPQLSDMGVKMVKDLMTGRTGDGKLKGKKSIPGMKHAKNPWHDLDTPENQPLLNKVLNNYYKKELKNGK